MATAVAGLLRAGAVAASAAVAQPALGEESRGWIREAVDGASRRVTGLYRDGRTDLIVSGYYWHLPYAYSRERRAELNDTAWGLGLARSRVDERDNEEGLYVLASHSSHFKPQYGIGYWWLARWRIAGPVRVGAGFSAFIFSRSDIYRYAPLPGIVPLASVGTDRFAVHAAFLPHISNGITGRGNVVYVFARVALE